MRDRERKKKIPGRPNNQRSMNINTGDADATIYYNIKFLNKVIDFYNYINYNNNSKMPRASIKETNMNKRVPDIAVVERLTGSTISDLYLNTTGDYIGFIDLDQKKVVIENLWLDNFTKLDLCLALAYDSILSSYVKFWLKLESDDYEDVFQALYSLRFEPQGEYEVHILGDNLVLESYNNEEEAEYRALYLTEHDEDGEKYEVIVRGNPYERFNS